MKLPERWQKIVDQNGRHIASIKLLFNMKEFRVIYLEKTAWTYWLTR